MSKRRLGITSPTIAVSKWALFLCMVLIAGCAGMNEPGETAEQIVEERANQRWESILTGELDVAYEMLSPAQRSMISSLAYKRDVLGSPVRWKSAEVKEVECEELTCRVSIEVGMDIIGAVPGVPRFTVQQDLEEQWILTDGSWWFVSK